MDVARTKDLIQFYKSKRLFLFLDEWGFYLLLVGMHYLGFSALLILPILFYGSVGIYTSYKNLDLIEQKIIPLEQEIYAFKDLYSLYKYITCIVAAFQSRPLTIPIKSSSSNIVNESTSE